MANSCETCTTFQPFIISFSDRDQKGDWNFHQYGDNQDVAMIVDEYNCVHVENVTVTASSNADRQEVAAYDLKQLIARSDKEQDVPQALKDAELPRILYKDTIERLQRSSKVRYYQLCYNRWLHSAMLACAFLLIWLCGLSVWMQKRLSEKLGAILFFFVAMATVLLWLFAVGTIKRKLNDKMADLLADINEQLANHKLIIGLSEEGIASCYRVTVFFIYFDNRHCLETLLKDLNVLVVRQLHGKKTKDICIRGRIVKPKNVDPINTDADFIISSGETTESQRQNLAKTLLYSYSSCYAQALRDGKLRKPIKSRHSNGTTCLCQFIEKLVFNIDV